MDLTHERRTRQLHGRSEGRVPRTEQMGREAWRTRKSLREAVPDLREGQHEVTSRSGIGGGRSRVAEGDFPTRTALPVVQPRCRGLPSRSELGSGMCPQRREIRFGACNERDSNIPARRRKVVPDRLGELAHDRRRIVASDRSLDRTDRRRGLLRGRERDARLSTRKGGDGRPGMHAITAAWSGPRATIVDLTPQLSRDRPGGYVKQSRSAVCVSEPGGDFTLAPFGRERQVDRSVRRESHRLDQRREHGVTLVTGVSLSHQDQRHRGIAGSLPVIGQHGCRCRPVSRFVTEIGCADQGGIDLAVLKRPYRELEGVYS